MAMPSYMKVTRATRWIEFITMLAAFGAMDYGNSVAGGVGWVTGLVTVVMVGGGLTMASMAPAGSWQRKGFLIAALLAGIGAFLMGWDLGWAGAIAGYLIPTSVVMLRSEVRNDQLVIDGALEN